MQQSLDGISYVLKMVSKVAVSSQALSPAPPVGVGSLDLSYNITSHVPLLRCSPVNATFKSELIELMLNATDLEGFPFPASMKIDNDGFSPTTFHLDEENLEWSYLDSRDPSYCRGEIGYFAAAPRIMPIAVASQPNDTSTQYQLAYMQQRSIAASRLLFSIKNYAKSHRPVDFFDCQIHNSSLSFKVELVSGIGHIRDVKRQWLNQLEVGLRNCTASGFQSFPFNTVFDLVVNHVQGSVSNVLWDSQHSTSQQEKRRMFNGTKQLPLIV